MLFELCIGVVVRMQHNAVYDGIILQSIVDGPVIRISTKEVLTNF